MKRAEVFAFLEEQGIAYRLEEHAAVFTVAESSKVMHEKVPVKTLLLREEKGTRVFMIAMRGDVRLDTKNLAKELGVKKLQFVKPENVEALVGVKPGSVSIFGLLHDGSSKLEVVLDESLLGEREIGFHPNDNTATIFMSPQDIEKVFTATGHRWRILAV